MFTLLLYSSISLQFIIEAFCLLFSVVIVFLTYIKYVFAQTVFMFILAEMKKKR